MYSAGKVYHFHFTYSIPFPKDTTDEDMMGTFEGCITHRDVVLEWSVIVSNITGIVTTYNIYRNGAAFLKKGSAEACEQSEALEKEVGILLNWYLYLTTPVF